MPPRALRCGHSPHLASEKHFRGPRQGHPYCVYISRGATASTGSPPREGAARLCSARDAYPRDYAEGGWPRVPTTKRPEGGGEAKKTRPQAITTKIEG